MSKEQQVNLLGELQDLPETVDKPKGRNKFKTMQEIHGVLEGKICGACEHCACHTHQRNYYKCELWYMSKSASTDIRLSNQACNLWKPQK